MPSTAAKMAFECGGREAGMWKHSGRKRAHEAVAFVQQICRHPGAVSMTIKTLPPIRGCNQKDTVSVDLKAF
ncbi:hypothetical protein PZ897_03340 [Hoeflea sp. YIM 152468]|uniref:hypothetical protein n=1 Tax=Hoeflea sp. YIM 152468 TaxID=3031759 RepID=UPI0023DB0450|nr:hypothetical protein [Hoeflea sp. YIM 152468]MDF1607204.1 hypothetical protein [Hoeflea sp. YIM 152468]